MNLSTLNKYNGTLYPVQDLSVLETPVTVQSLVDLCSGSIVKDSRSTQAALRVIPQDLCYSLMKAAICHDKDRSVEVLVARWPWPTLYLAKFAPEMFTSMDALYDESYIRGRMRHGIKYTTCLAHTFVECLKKRTPTRLKCLDLTGFPTAEVIVNYLSSHVLLVHNEVRQREIITVYNEMTRTWPEDQRNKYAVDTTLPDDSYTVRLDVSLENISTHMELCRALRVSSQSQSRFKVQVRKLDLTCLGAARISVLLEEVQPQAITALSLQFNSLGFEGIMVLGPLIRTLQNLTGLDLSCNAVDLRRTEVCEQMRRTLSSLPCLSRLNMCGNWIKSHLQTLVSDIQKPLEYLRLGGCGLQKEDIAYLQRSHHATSLQSLDISECIMRSPDVMAVLLSLLRALAPSVQELVMEDMGLAQEEWEQVVSQCHQMVNLRFWNITHNVNIVSSVLTSSVSQFVKMPKLQVLHFDFPAECYIAVDPNEVEVEQLAFFNTYSRLLTLQCLESNRPFIKLVPRQ